MQRQVGTQNQIAQVMITSSTTGLPVTGLTYSSSGLAAYYKRNTASSDVAISLVATTLGTWASGGFVEVDSTNMPGLYELGVPNAALVSGADLVTVEVTGTSLLVAPVQIELTATNNQDGVRGGMTALPAAPMMVKKNQAFNYFPFLMTNSANVPLSGLTSITAQRMIDNGAFAACTNSPTETGNGMYTLNLSAADVDGNCITFLFTAAGAQARYLTVITQP